MKKDVKRHPQKTSAEEKATAWQLALRWLYSLLFLLLPFRWNFAAPVIEQGNFPVSLEEWLVFTMWPQSVFEGAVLLVFFATVALYAGRMPAKRNCTFSAAVLMPVVAVAVLCSGVPGLLNTTETAYAGNWMRHFGSIALLVIGMYVGQENDRKLSLWVVNAIALGTLYAVLEGWYQHFGGLEKLLAEQMEAGRDLGIALTEDVLYKMRQTRSYGHFADPNLYAAHIILTSPVLLLATRNVCRRCEQSRQALWLFMPVVSALCLGALFFSGSRGAMIGMAAGLALGAFCLLGKKLSRGQWCLVASLAVLIAVGTVAALNMATKRDFATASVRCEYYAAAWKIMTRYPWAGAGLGEYFPWHMRLKNLGADEARDAHCIPLGRFAQGGILCGMVALFQLMLPLLLALGWLKRFQREEAWLAALVLGGCFAWNVHALFQFNDMVISTVAMAFVMEMFIFDTQKKIPFRMTFGHKVNAALLCAVLLFGVAAVCMVVRECVAEYAIQQAETYSRKADAGTAEGFQLCDRAIRLKPASVIAPKSGYALAMKYGKWTEAEKYARALCDATPHRASSWQRLAISRRVQGQNVEDCLKMMEMWYPTQGMAAFLRQLDCADLDEEAIRDAIVSTSIRMDGYSDNEVTYALRGAGINDELCRKLNAVKNAAPDGRIVRFVNKK